MSELQQRVAALRERASTSFPEAWIASDQECEFVGYFRRLEGPAQTKNGPVYVAIFAEAQTGVERSVWLVHTALRNELARQKPRHDELVLIRYEGIVEPHAGGRAYAGYRVVVDREATPGDWAALGQDAAAAGAADPAPVSSHEPAPGPAEPPAYEAQCPRCGGVNGGHEQGCPEDIPF